MRSALRASRSPADYRCGSQTVVSGAQHNCHTGAQEAYGPDTWCLTPSAAVLLVLVPVPGSAVLIILLSALLLGGHCCHRLVVREHAILSVGAYSAGEKSARRIALPSTILSGQFALSSQAQLANFALALVRVPRSGPIPRAISIIRA